MPAPGTLTFESFSAARYFAGDPFPVPVLDGYETDEDTPLSVPAPGLLANDFLPPPGPSAVLVHGPTHGTVL